jgi:ribose-phosphate pyrophosphokinase
MAARLKAPLAIVEKRRLGNNDLTETLNIIGDVRGKTAITFDDEIDTAGSLVNAVEALLKEGATEVYACASHPVLSGPAVERIAVSPVKEIIVSNTIPLPDAKKLDKITVLPLAPLLGEAIHRIHTGLSVGAMYDE